ncbi:MAG: ThiF family adenylyltransferase [Geothrix sp.]|nr:ThiF family adenylyltransferase [Geothrix sp.]
MIEIAISEDDLGKVKSEILNPDEERCAVLLASSISKKSGLVRLIVQNIEIPQQGDYQEKGPCGVTLRPSFVANVVKKAKISSQSVIFVHSHVAPKPPLFSIVDDGGEVHLRTFLEKRIPGQYHAALVISTGGLRARQLGTKTEARVISLGHRREILFDPCAEVGPTDGFEENIYDRQVRAFGELGQRAIQDLCIGIVGLGGTGSLVAQQLVHLGVHNFILIDPDSLEISNLNRIPNASNKDVGKSKVSIAKAYIRKINKFSKVAAILGDVTKAKIARHLLETDFIFSCTDSHGSRAVIQQIVYQYFIPCIDMGTVISAKKGRVAHIYGRVQLLSPGLACFTCSGLLNYDEVRQDMMTQFERKADPYFRGARVPAPAVISLNGSVSSIAVTMFLGVVAGFPVEARYVLQNMMNSSARPVTAKPDPACFICSRSGAMGRGDQWRLMARQD